MINTFANDISVDGKLTANDDLIVNGDVTLGSNASDIVIINGITTMNNDLIVNGDVTLNEDNTTTTTVNGKLTANDDLEVKGGGKIDGKLECKSSVEVINSSNLSTENNRHILRLLKPNMNPNTNVEIMVGENNTTVNKSCKFGWRKMENDNESYGTLNVHGYEDIITFNANEINLNKQTNTKNLLVDGTITGTNIMVDEIQSTSINTTTINNFRINNSSTFTVALPVIPVIKADSVMEVGKYIDFHEIGEESNDYSVRLTATSDSLKCNKDFFVKNRDILAELDNLKALL
jgi:cytoskeletal protein CcmA (bactofilin family)